jgi:hypothetical protein
MSDKKDLAKADRKEVILELSAAITSAVPWIGGPVSSVLNGLGVQRRFERIQGVLEGMTQDLRDFRSDVSENYVKTDDFQELLEKTLRQAAEERNDSKRRLYKDFLVGATKSPGSSFDEQVRFLKTLEQIDPDHVRVLHALLADPVDAPSITGSPRQTLMRRLPGLSADRITELVNGVDDLRLTNGLGRRLVVMMTGRGSADLRLTLTDFGRKFVESLGAC